MRPTLVARFLLEIALLGIAAWIAMVLLIGALAWTAGQIAALSSNGLGILAVAASAAFLLVALLAWRKPRPPFEPGDFL